MLAGGRLFYKQLDSISRVTSSSSVRHINDVSQPGKETNKPLEAVVIPPRIERGPTDILKALSATVGHDPTGFPYKFPDDPYFQVNSSFRKKVLALAMESGRKSAKFIIEQYPHLFQHKLSEPAIEAFTPKIKPKEEKTDFTESDLISAIEVRDVPQAIKIYENLEQKNSEVSKTTQQCLLELVCFYNSSPVREVHEEEKWLGMTSSGKEEIWKKNGFAEKLFSKMESNCPLANSAIILGRFKYNDAQSALEKFEEARKAGLKLPIEVYNYVLRRKRSHSDLFIYERFFNEMFEQGIHPNEETSVAMLHTLCRLNFVPGRMLLAMKLVKEFKMLRIKPPLACYTYLFRILQNDLENGNLKIDEALEIASGILDEIENVEHEIIHREDFDFFSTVMRVFSHSIADPDLGIRLLNMYLKNNNFKFLVKEISKHLLFVNFFNLLFKTKPVDYAFEQLQRYNGGMFIADVKLFNVIFTAISDSYKPELLPKLWKTIQENSLDGNRIVLSHFLKMVDIFSDEQSLKIFHEVAIKALTKVEERNLEYEELDTFSDLLITFVKNDDINHIVEVLKEVNESKIVVLSQNSLKLALEYALSKKDAQLFVKLLPFAANANAELASEFAKKALPSLSGEDRSLAQMFLISEKKDNKKNLGAEEP